MATAVEVQGQEMEEETETYHITYYVPPEFFKNGKRGKYRGKNYAFQCCICSRQISTNYKSRANLRAHVKRQHAGSLNVFDTVCRNNDRRCSTATDNPSEEQTSSSTMMMPMMMPDFISTGRNLTPEDFNGRNDMNGEKAFELNVKPETTDGGSDMTDYAIEVKQEDQTNSEEFMCLIEEESKQGDLANSGSGPNGLYNFFTKSEEYKAAIGRTNTYVICDLCHKHVRTQKGSTSNLYVHLKAQHLTQYNSLKLTDKPPIDDRTIFEQDQRHLRRRMRYVPNGIEHRTRTRALTELLCVGMVPINLVAHPKFMQLIYLLDPKYDLPSRNDIRDKEIPAIYYEVKNEIVSELTRTSSFSLTVDAWMVNTVQHFCLTVHYIIDEPGGDWALQSKCLATSNFSEEQNGATVVDTIEEIFSEYGLLKENLQCLTTDLGTNVTKALEQLTAKQFPSISQVLHEAVTEALKATSRIWSTLTLCCRDLVSVLSCSEKKKQELCAIQQSLLQNFENNETAAATLTIKADVSTEWNSTFKMVKSIHENRTALQQLLSKDEFKDHSLIKLVTNDVEILENLISVLEPFHNLTAILSDEKAVTVSSVAPLIDHINECCRKMKGDADFVAIIKENIQTYLKERYCEKADMKLLRQCAYLDPQYRDQIELSEDEIAHLQAQLITISREMEHSIKLPNFETETTSPAPKKSLYSVLRKTQTHNSSNPVKIPTHQDKVNHELSLYQTMPMDPEDPLLFWSSHQLLFPITCKFIRRMFCMSASSSASNRLFNLSGNVVMKKGGAMRPELINMQAFLAYNLR